MPTITTSGKVKCDFCKRDFDTISEQQQHMNRRHSEQLKEHDIKCKHKKEKQKKSKEDEQKKA